MKIFRNILLSGSARQVKIKTTSKSFNVLITDIKRDSRAILDRNIHKACSKVNVVLFASLV